MKPLFSSLSTVSLFAIFMACSLFNPLKAIAADESDLRLKIAEKLEAKGQLDQALQELRLFTAEHPERADALVATARIQMRLGKPNDAVGSYHEALLKAPQDQTATLGLAEALEKTGDKKAATAEWRRLMALSPDPSIRKQAEAHWKALNNTPEPTRASPPSKPVVIKPPAINKTTASTPSANTAKGNNAPAVLPSKTTPSNSSTPETQINATPGASNPTAAKVKTVAETDPISKENQAGNAPVTHLSGSKPLPADPAYDAALNFYREDKKKEALEKIRQVLQHHPAHAGAYYLGGVIRYEMGDMKKAAYNFKRSFNHPEKGYNAHYYLGRIYQKQGLKDEALKEFEQYAESTPSETGKQQAQAFIDQLKKSNAEEIAPHGQDQKAEKSEVKSDPPSKLSAEVPKAEPEAGDGEKPQAEHPIPSLPGESITEAPTHPPLVMPLEDGFLFLIPDSLSPSGKKMREAHALYRQEKIEKSIQTLQSIVRDFGGTENADVALLNLAALYLKLSLWDNAITQLETFTSGNPARVGRYFGLANDLMGRARFGKSDYEKAEKFFLKVKPGEAFSPSLEERDWQLAQCAPYLKDPTAQSSYYDHALASASLPLRRAWLRLRLGLLHAAGGRNAKAMDFLKAVQEDCKVPETKATCAEAQVRYADMAFRAHDLKTALEQYQAFEKNYPKTPDIPWVLYQIGNIHKAGAHWEMALNAYKRLIDNYPDSYWAAQAKWQREDAIWQKEYEEVLN